MTAARPVPADPAPLPERGARVLLDGLPGGPWSTVVASRAGGLLTLAAPRLGGSAVALPLARPFLIAYAHREVPCAVDAVLVGGGPGDEDRGYVARTEGAPRRMQRRSAVRVPIHLLARASVADGGAEPLGAVTENLSAAGALLRLADPLEVGAPVRVSIRCGGDAGVLEPSGRVARCDRTGADARPWRVAIAFDDLDGDDEQRLVRFVFERQRELRARETGLG